MRRRRQICLFLGGKACRAIRCKTLRPSLAPLHFAATRPVCRSIVHAGAGRLHFAPPLPGETLIIPGGHYYGKLPTVTTLGAESLPGLYRTPRARILSAATSAPDHVEKQNPTHEQQPPSQAAAMQDMLLRSQLQLVRSSERSLRALT